MECRFRTQQIEYEIEIDAPGVSSLAFGGKDMDILYVTSASENLFGQTEPQPAAGGRLFSVEELGVHGLEMKSARVPV